MAEYQLTASEHTIFKVEGGWYIPDDPANTMYQEYLAWVEDGGVPDPYVPPEPAPDVPTPGEEVAFDHENRIRALEGQPPLSQEEFIGKKMSG